MFSPVIPISESVPKAVQVPNASPADFNSHILFLLYINVLGTVTSHTSFISTGDHATEGALGLLLEADIEKVSS